MDSLGPKKALKISELSIFDFRAHRIKKPGSPAELEEPGLLKINAREFRMFPRLNNITFFRCRTTQHIQTFGPNIFRTLNPAPLPVPRSLVVHMCHGRTHTSPTQQNKCSDQYGECNHADNNIPEMKGKRALSEGERRISRDSGLSSRKLASLSKQLSRTSQLQRNYSA